ncbi:hypothetical protein PFISCL1PPCAC_28412, partial [Pristionchus fissidentatus]
EPHRYEGGSRLRRGSFHRSGHDLLNFEKKRPNIISIVEEARHSHKHRMLVGMADTMLVLSR